MTQDTLVDELDRIAEVPILQPLSACRRWSAQAAQRKRPLVGLGVYGHSQARSALCVARHAGSRGQQSGVVTGLFHFVIRAV
jgi:hypothetical protein